MTKSLKSNWKVSFSILALLFSLAGLQPTALAAEQRDCDDNAVIRCGVLSQEELYNTCWQNSNGTIKIFREFGIRNCDALVGLQEGRVTADNKVYVGDKLVATDAFTAGRHNIPGSTPIADGIAFKRPPSMSFVDQNGSLRALVKMDGQTFRFAVITSCGNPVMATPVAPPPPPAQPPTVTKTVYRASTVAPSSPPRQQPVERIVYKEQPAPKPILPATGAGNVLGMAVSLSIGGFGAHQLVSRLATRLRLK